MHLFPAAPAARDWSLYSGWILGLNITKLIIITLIPAMSDHAANTVNEYDLSFTADLEAEFRVHYHRKSQTKDGVWGLFLLLSNFQVLPVNSSSTSSIMQVQLSDIVRDLPQVLRQGYRDGYLIHGTYVERYAAVKLLITWLYEPRIAPAPKQQQDCVIDYHPPPVGVAHSSVLQYKCVWQTQTCTSHHSSLLPLAGDAGVGLPLSCWLLLWHP